jgi:uncharacterized protein (DUF952 family)
MSALVYKILRRREWVALQTTGEFAGSPDDLRDGFVHLSTLEQLPGTLATHFGGESDLVLVELEAPRLGQALRWEASRGGTLFPHLYGTLRLADVTMTSTADSVD